MVADRDPLPPAWRVLAAVLILPGTITVAVPALLLRSFDSAPGWTLPSAAALAPLLLGLGLLGYGVHLMAGTNWLLRTTGRGTLAPWDPTTKLVIRGPYRRVRNPMISGVFAVLTGEALLFGSAALFLWFALFVTLNAVYIPLVEEPGLMRRFGRDYLAYKDNVPRWIPRHSPWHRRNS